MQVRLLSSYLILRNKSIVVWKVTPLFASWITSPLNPLVKHELINAKTTVLELGSGISGIIALALSPLVGSYTLTDQSYVFKLLRQNLDGNKSISSSSRPRKSGSKSKKHEKDIQRNIQLQSLDWQTDSAASLPGSYDLIIACDCIYNDALITPLVSTLVDAAKLRNDGDKTIVIIGQQRRSSEVFEDWLIAFHKFFRTWRVPDEILGGSGLQSGSGYLVHIGILREDAQLH